MPLFPHLPFDPQAVFLDFNGVLIDDEHLHFLLFRDLLAEENFTLSQADYDSRFIALDDEGVFDLALQEAGRDCSEAAIARLVQEKARRYLELAPSQAPVFAGAAALLAALKNTGTPTAIVRGALLAEIRFHLLRMGIEHWPQVVVAAEEDVPGKPHPGQYQLALARLRERVGALVPAQCLAVEDTAGGVQAASAAGLWTVGVLHTTPAEQLLQAGAKKLVADLPTLLA